MDTKKEDYSKKRLIELANISYRRNIPMYSEFLNLYEQNILMTLLKELPPVSYKLSGGHEHAERCMAVFYTDSDQSHLALPLSILKIEPVHVKFSDNLSHRDYLGAIMNLGIERNLIGDILIESSKTAYIFVHEKITEYILDNLIKIKHTNIKAEQISNLDFVYNPSFKEITGTVASIRLDKITSLSFGMPRSKMIQYIESGLVFVNGKNITSNGYILKEDDIISVRGLGRCVYTGCSNVSKKGRLIVNIKKYI